jgi:gamma-glutamylcyclotransferase (GGCT)/AIG2-like uncharacterized protein YtfP
MLPYTLYDTGWSFPALVENTDPEDLNPITLEVYEVPPEVERSLDCLEGYPNFYTKHYLPDFYVYVLPRESIEDSYSVVDCGDWVDYLREKPLSSRYG